MFKTRLTQVQEQSQVDSTHHPNKQQRWRQCDKRVCMCTQRYTCAGAGAAGGDTFSGAAREQELRAAAAAGADDWQPPQQWHSQVSAVHAVVYTACAPAVVVVVRVYAAGRGFSGECTAAHAVGVQPCLHTQERAPHICSMQPIFMHYAL